MKASATDTPQPSAVPISARTGALALKAELLPALTAAVLATVIGVWALQLWKANLRVPFVVGAGDDLFNLIGIKDVITHGWDLTNPSLGAPFGLKLYDFPALSGDSFYMAIIKVLGMFSDDPAVVTNVFYLLGFPLIAMTAFGVLRRLGISVGSAIVCAVLYAVLPFRLDNYETHLFLSSYFIVPICCCLILFMFTGSELFVLDPQRVRLRAHLTVRTAAIGLLCLVIGSADNYFALFTVALMVPAAILAFFSTRRLRPLIGGLVAAALILGAVALNGLPTLIYHAQHGPNGIPSTRLPQESDTWGLSLARLVLPIEGSRIPWLAKLAHHYNSTATIPASSPASESAFNNLGIVGTLGLLWIMLVLAVQCLRERKQDMADRRAVHAALAAGIAFLIGTVGGLATLFAYIVNPQLHAPNRIAIFIAFFALFGAALGLDRLCKWARSRRGGRIVTITVLLLVLSVGVLYQTSPSMVPNYRSEIEQYHLRSQFVSAIEAQLPANASIFQLPYVPFPQGQNPSGIGEYENLYVYFVSKSLRWTGGAMEGRPTDWVPKFLNRPLARVIEGVSAVGFNGIEVEPAGIPNSSATLGLLQSTLGVAPLTGANGQLVFFNMETYNRRLREHYSAAQIAGIAAAALGSQS